MLSLGIAPEHIVLIPGSGVDIKTLQPLPEPHGAPTVAFVGRLLKDKGIHTLIRAHRLLRQRNSNAQLLIAGTPDPANPASVSQTEAAGWGREPGITWLGHVDDIGALWARAHIAVLPSRREGLPKSLLEAAACGRPMIAADVPGCREIVIPDETGLLVPFDDAAALADAIDTLAAAPDLRARYGAAARKLAVERFSAGTISRQTVDLYRQLVGRGGPA
jgi:glycosyltransferase involved in cell wall biosynthesis